MKQRESDGTLRSHDDLILRAESIAEMNPDDALRIARLIRNSLYRAQAIAWVARFSPSERFDRIIEEARSASLSAEDGYIKTISACWYIRAMIERDRSEHARDDVLQVMACANDIPHPVSRLEATSTLFEAVFAVNEYRRLAVDRLIQAGGAAKSWRSGFWLREAAIMLAFSKQAGESDQIVESMPAGIYRRQALTRIGRGQRREPRPFFW